MKISPATIVLATLCSHAAAFTVPYTASRHPTALRSSVEEETAPAAAPVDPKKADLQRRKAALLKLLGSPAAGNNEAKTSFDPVLACPKTKRPLKAASIGTIINDSIAGTSLTFTPDIYNGYSYEGKSNGFYNLLVPVEEQQSEEGPSVNPRSLIPPPLRSALVTYGVLEDDGYIPMRDLFTSPTVSFAYERGWRQGFAAAGFPGADKEFELACEWFDPVVRGAFAAPDNKKTTVVDMSCATGLFTRRFAKSDMFDRVLGCDYSASMLTEARRRIGADKEIDNNVELVQLDVGQIPMQDKSVECVHAGAAMHCWPDVVQGLREIHRVLVPGGRYFATTFLSDYFRAIQSSEGGSTGPSRQAFQLFKSQEDLQGMLIEAGFDPSKVSTEVLGSACVVIRCEK